MSVGVALTDTTFAEYVGAADVPVLVDFWAAWCGPCRIFDPVLAELAAEDPRFQLASVDIDANPGLAVQFGVLSAPTLVLIAAGQMVWHSTGARGRGRLRDDLEAFL
ncbi:MAG: thioredoxin family protein [Actinomycetota bacterium]|nr:thioredoxin family protein [Actinomycetota bacterium]